ncbi:MAG: RNA methyltransferase [Bacteroides sp. SM23_62_1]|nr:MAG: RNA methyltransferase [Bacteroides sp. SM23_62_1]
MRKLKNDELGRLSVEDFKKAKKTPVVVILDNVRSSHNIGSVFRTSDAFLVEAIYLCGITSKPPHKDIHKTALGATESVEWYYCEKTLEPLRSLKEKGYILVAVEQTTESISLQHFRIDRSKSYAFVFGHEVRGVDQQVVDECDISLDIPQYGTKHSLNISVTAGLVIWEAFRQFRMEK